MDIQLGERLLTLVGSTLRKVREQLGPTTAVYIVVKKSGRETDLFNQL